MGSVCGGRRGGGGGRGRGQEWRERWVSGADVGGREGATVANLYVLACGVPSWGLHRWWRGQGGSLIVGMGCASLLKEGQNKRKNSK